jgi:hypothetical protein
MDIHIPKILGRVEVLVRIRERQSKGKCLKNSPFSWFGSTIRSSDVRHLLPISNALLSPADYRVRVRVRMRVWVRVRVRVRSCLYSKIEGLQCIVSF